MVLALECAADFLILDDAKARKAASALDLPVVGTVAVLHNAAEKGLLRDIDDTLARLRQAGFRFVQ
jgi:predicted nucleic acid-binding protein